MTRTDFKTPTTRDHKHDHGLGQVDTALAGKAATTHTHAAVPHTHPEIAALEARIAALETPVAPPPVIPPPVIPPTSGTVVQFPGGGASTVAAFAAMAADTGNSIIEIAAGTYANWACFLNVDRTAAHPLLVRPAPNAAVVWDGGGSANPPFRIGWNSKASYITFEPAGTGGSFTMQNYHLSLSGLVMARYFDHVTFNGATVRNCYGTNSLQTEHCVYVGSSSEVQGGLPRSQYWTSNNWDVVGPANRWFCGIQTYHGPSADHVTANGWTVSNLHRAAYFYSDPTAVLMDSWTIADCNATVDNDGYTATGTVSNCHATNSGTLAPGSGYWMANGLLVSGGGNTAS